MTIKVKAKEINWMSVGEKAISTALQSFLAIWVVTDTSSVKGALTAAAAAGIAVLKNAVKEYRAQVDKA
tara:strand:+ start:7918 stop:8124 length:207 start_codon:yes stop_codon:yes gene_type:complete